MKEGKPKRKQKEHKLLEQVPQPAGGGAEAAPNPFARALGSSDYHTREAGLEALAQLLASRRALGELEALKLWRGVFYAYWHSDKAPVQAALAERLSEIMGRLPEETGWLYYAAFVRTMRREWAGIDHLRLDKFLMLVRKFFAALLRQLQAHAWQARRLERAAAFWRDEVLLPCDGLAAAGLAYHLADLLLPELAGCVGEGGGGAAPDDATLRALLEPFCAALARADSPAMLHRLRQGLFDPLVDEVRQPSEAAPLRGLDAAALAAHLFDLGAQPETRARNRAALYELSAALEKAVAKRQRKQGQQPEAEPRSAGKAPRHRGSAAEEVLAQQTAAQQQQQQADAAPTPASGKKGKKRRQSEGGAAADTTPSQQQQQQHAAPAPAAQASPALPPPSSSKKKKGQKSRLGPADEGAAAAGQADQQQQQQQQPITEQEQELLAAAVERVMGGTPGGATPGTASKKKAVRFSLKRNLVNVIGQPPKPADVRTPPTSKPKGPALKRESAFPGSAPERLLTRAGVERLAQFHSYMNGRASGAPGSASRLEQQAAAGGGGKKQKQKRRASTGSLSRPRAADFF